MIKSDSLFKFLTFPMLPFCVTYKRYTKNKQFTLLVFSLRNCTHGLSNKSHKQLL